MNQTQVHGGFMVLETMIYSFVLILLAVLSMTYATQVYRCTQQALEVQRQYAQLWVTLDTCMRDLVQAPLHKASWKRATKTEHIWSTTHADVGLATTPHGIIRSQGTFDTKKQTWTKRTKSFLPPGIAYTLEPVSQDEQCIYLVDLTITDSDNRHVATSIALRSGASV